MLRMKTIKFQVFFIVLAGIITASVIIGGFGIFWSNASAKRSSARILDLTSQVQTSGLNAMFTEVEQSSKVLSDYVSDEIQNLEDLLDEEKFSRYIARLENVAYYIASCTKPALAVSVRFAPSLTNEVSSLLWYKKNGSIIQGKLREFPSYNYDLENSWYYKALLTGHNSWTKPYYNDDLNEYVISLGVPVFKDGKFIAVVGMDIDFDDIAHLVNTITIYDTGYACLTDENFLIIYHRSMPMRTPLLTNTDKFKLYKVDNIENDFCEYKTKNRKHKMLYKNLVNGMRLIVSVPSREIDRERSSLIISLIVSVFAISFSVSIWSVWMSNKFTRPLKKLSYYAKNIIEGDYNVKFDFSSDDEVGELTRNFALMAKSLERQFEYINSLAYFDAMTGAKNKRSFIDARDDVNLEIQKARRENQKLEFALIVFDVNNLKLTNDTYGHKAGDLLIKCACNLIMKNFVYSTIYRIGGDEFVAIVRGKDYENRNELIENLHLDMDTPVAEKNKAFEKVSIAAGMAVYDSKVDENFQTVFERADEEMYRTKVAMKGGIELVR